MKRLLYIITVAILLFASCERNTRTQTPNIPQREGIQWGEFLSVNEGNSFALPYRTTDGTEDTLSCDLVYCDFDALGEIDEEDINFDGIPDVQIWLGNQNWWGNVLYEGFVWNKEKGCFDWVEKYHEIYSPSVYKDSLCIIGDDYFSFEGFYTATFTKYQWINGELVETGSWEESGSTWGHDEDEDETTDVEREGIQWGDIHFGPINSWGEVANAWLLYTTADGTVDSLEFTLSYEMKLEEFTGGAIEEKDINFDGIPDLQICLGCFDVPCRNVNYEGFVWDQEESTFVLVPNFSMIMNPSIDDHSLISYDEDMDQGRPVYYCTKYQWVDGELVEMESWYFDPFEDEVEEEIYEEEE